MSILILPNRFTQQPPGNAGKSGSDNGDGLLAFVAPLPTSTFLLDYVSGRLLTDPYAPSDHSFATKGFRNEGLFRNTGGGAYRNALSVGAASLQWTVLNYLRPTALVNTATTQAGLKVITTTSYTVGDITLGDGATNNIVAASIDGAPGKIVSDGVYTAGNFLALAYTANYVAGLENFYINGVAQTATGTKTNVSSNMILQTTQASGSFQVAANSSYVQFYAALVFTRVLSLSEIAAYSQKVPWQLLNAQRPRFWASSGAANASGDLTGSGVSGTGAAGSITANVLSTLAGVAGTGSAGAEVPNVLSTLSGAAGTSAAGSITANVLSTLTGVAGTGAAGAETANTLATVSGAAGTGTAGATTANDAALPLGASTTGAAGTITAKVSVLLSGVAGTGAMAQIINSPILQGVEGASAAGTFTPNTLLTLTGVGGAAQTGGLNVVVAANDSGVVGTGSAGDVIGGVAAVSASYALNGVASIGSAGTVTPITKIMFGALYDISVCTFNLSDAA